MSVHIFQRDDAHDARATYVSGTHSMALQVRTETFLCSLMNIQTLLFVCSSRVLLKNVARTLEVSPRTKTHGVRAM